MKKTAIIIPVYNEERYLPKFLQKLQLEIKKINEIKQIIFVNDGSTDETQKILEKIKKKNQKIKILKLRRNEGKGYAMKFGSQEAIKKGAKYLIYMDGDGQHDPQHLRKFIKELHQYSLVFGYRELKKNTPLIRRIGNQISSFIIRHIFRIERVGDVLCGYFAIKSNIYKKIKWRSNDYGVEAEISTIISREKIPFKEILVRTIYLDRTKGVNLLHAFGILLRIPFWAVVRHMNRTAGLLVFLGLTLIFLLLAFKNPFSVRSLIPNLEPYPDTLYYSSPAWNFIQGNGFTMKAFDYQSKVVTPPLYSLYLLPFFALFRDVRSFYFANMLLSIGSLALFVLTLNKLFFRKLTDILAVAFAGFFFVTNFYFYSQPYLLMAENITLLFSVLAIYLIVFPVSTTRSFWAGLVGLGLLMIKFSNAPLAAALLLLYGLRVFRLNGAEVRRSFIFSVAISGLIFAGYALSTQILVAHKNLSAGAGFSLSYFMGNFQQYLKVLIGAPERYLWFNYPMVSRLLAIPTILGIITGLITPKSRRLTLELLGYGLSVIAFMSIFYTRDIRYIIMVFPIMLLFMVFFFYFIQQRFGFVINIILMSLLGATYLFWGQAGQIPNERPIITFKKQVGLNFRHAEEPWNYKAVIEFNSFFSEKKDNQPYMGTLLPPYFVSFYSNGNYKYLPVSMGQEFFGDKQNAPKVFHTSLADYYKKLLNEGRVIYVSPYYQANLLSWKKDYENLIKEFDVTLVKEGCYNTCNIYRLTSLHSTDN